MKIKSAEELGKLIRNTRKSQGLTQSDLAIACKAGIRFIVELENGKETAQIGKTINVLNMLGLSINIGE
ncbi:MAG: hypothetical protein LUG16_04840 [Candidatus Gastranaerophilales bacterium]|nr:hypothetical protein [Candidatus Gastranaerophilales bacterium]